MKNISRFLVATLALFGVTSCNTAPVEELNLSTSTVTASFVDSRTTLSEGVKTLWSAEDKIEVNGVTFTLSAGAGEATATFTSATPLAAAESYNASYPAGVTAIAKSQTAVAGSFDPQAALAQATGSTPNNLLFEHRHALLKFALAAPALKVELLGYTLQGAMEPEKLYYVAVEAGTFEGLTAKVDDVEVRNTYNTVTLENGNILNLGTLPNAAVGAVGIRTADDLVAFASNPTQFEDASGVVNILANIDMTGKSWTPISDFTGTLEGNNHTIDNLVVENATHAAMFKNLSGATIQNLVFGKGCSFTVTGTETVSYAGAVVGQILTGATLKNIKSYATVTGGIYIGGICGAADKKVDGILFEDCVNSGNVVYPAVPAYANISIGGVVGQVEKKVTIENCTNAGTVTNKSNDGNKYNKTGGIIGGSGDVVMNNCKNIGTVAVDVRNANHIWIGGLIGSSYRGNVSNCSNSGSVLVSDNIVGNASMYVGGCFGALEGNGAPSGGTFYKYTNCTNDVPITVNKDVTKDTLLGGIIGYLYLVDVQVEECSNSGAITLTKQGANSAAGGIVGLIGKTSSSKPVNGSQINNCTNTGAVSMNSPANENWVHIGGIVGATTHNMTSINGCINRGNVTVSSYSKSNPAGIISQAQCNVTNCVNYGTICTTDAHKDYFSGTAGIVSRLNLAGITCSNCVNYGTIVYQGKGFKNANTNKGIVGQAGVVGLCNYGTVENCENYGTILGNDYDVSLGGAEYKNAQGSIVGWGAYNAAVTIKNCKVGGAVGAYVEADEDFGAAKATAITAENYADYIYGGNAKNGVTVSDCTFGAAN